MIIEELTLLDCEQGHRFYVPNDQLVNEDDEEIDLGDVQCPICGDIITTFASRTVLVAVTGKDTLELWDYDEKRSK